MNFEAQHNLKTDGMAGPAVWGAVLTAVETGQGNRTPLQLRLVTKTLPETRHRLLRTAPPSTTTLANTGVAAATDGGRHLPRVRAPTR